VIPCRAPVHGHALEEARRKLGEKKKRNEKGIILMHRKAKRFDCDGNEPEIGLI
jgi:hypothetical protein